MLPYNRIREVIELEVRYEQRNHGLRRDVEAVDTPESTIYTKNMVWFLKRCGIDSQKVGKTNRLF